MSSTIINEIEGIENKTYLELGVDNNFNFSKILCSSKMSVDINGKAMFTGTTDEFFSSISEDKMWDIIYIDANHDYEYVLRDFNNSVKHCREWILIHDMIPPNKEHCDSSLCSDSYKLLMYFLTEERNFEVYPMDEDYGLTIVKMPSKKAIPNAFREVSYKNFMEFISGKHLYSKEEMKYVLNNRINTKEDLIVVNSHPNTLEKEQILKNCINQLRKSEREILLVSHFPVREKIYKEADYYNYDKRNFESEKSMLFWYENKGIYFQTFSFLRNFSAAVFISIQNSFYLAKALGKKYIYYFEGDCFISDNDIKKLDIIKNKILKDKKNGWVIIKRYKELKGISTCFFILDVDFFINNFSFVDKIEDIGSYILETFMYKHISANINMFSITEKTLGDIFPESQINLISNDYSSHFIDILPEKKTKRPTLVITENKGVQKEYKIEFIKDEGIISTESVIISPKGYYYNILHPSVCRVKVSHDNQIVFDYEPKRYCKTKKKDEYIRI